MVITPLPLADAGGGVTTSSRREGERDSKAPVLADNAPVACPLLPAALVWPGLILEDERSPARNTRSACAAVGPLIELPASAPVRLLLDRNRRGTYGGGSGRGSGGAATSGDGGGCEPCSVEAGRSGSCTTEGASLMVTCFFTATPGSPTSSSMYGSVSSGSEVVGCCVSLAVLAISAELLAFSFHNVKSSAV